MHLILAASGGVAGAARRTGPVLSNRTPPQRQEPRTMPRMIGGALLMGVPAGNFTPAGVIS